MTWWRRAVFYEIYIRSFQDSNGDGIGDLNGITNRLGYLADLGIDAIWITPFYPSPQVDFGYDVSDYENVDPQYGTLADFDRLVSAAHRRSIRIVVDLVLNHTSDRHPWFESSRGSRSSPFRDWYVWRDGAAAGPPNNWESAFGGPAWTFDNATGQWYYHFFYAAQPDLNWRNPAVEARMFDVVKFWIDRGVDGFRLDAVNTLFEDPDLRDNPPLAEPKITLTGVRTQDYRYTRGLPEMHDVLRRLRHFINRTAPGTVLISEAYVDDAERLLEFYGNDDEMHLPFNFLLAQLPSLDARALRRTIADVERAFGDRWPSLVLSNHDIDRACDRYGGANADPVAKLLAMLLLTLRGTPFLYYGEELGMRTEPPSRREDVRDPVGLTFWPRYKGRDGVRRPMPWNGDARSGFTRAAPWLGLPSDAATRNVARQRRDPSSIWRFCQALLERRRTSPALRVGRLHYLTGGSAVLAFTRRHDDDERQILLNMSDRRVVWKTAAGWRVAVATHRPAGEEMDRRSIQLAPFEGLLLEPITGTRTPRRSSRRRRPS